MDIADAAELSLEVEHHVLRGLQAEGDDGIALHLLLRILGNDEREVVDDFADVRLPAFGKLLGNAFRQHPGTGSQRGQAQEQHEERLFEIVGEDACGALDLGGTGTRLVILCRTGRSLIVADGLLVAFQSQDLCTDEAAVVLLRLRQQLLHHLVAGRLSLTVAAFSLSAVQAGQHDDAGNGTTHHPHPSDAPSETCGYLLGQRVVETIEVGKGCHHTLATTVACHEIVYGTLHSFI